VPESSAKTIQPGQRLSAHFTTARTSTFLLNTMLVFSFKLLPSPLRLVPANGQFLGGNKVVLLIAIDRVIAHSVSPSALLPFSTVFGHDHTVVKY